MACGQHANTTVLPSTVGSVRPGDHPAGNAAAPDQQPGDAAEVAAGPDENGQLSAPSLGEQGRTEPVPDTPAGTAEPQAAEPQAAEPKEAEPKAAGPKEAGPKEAG